MDTKRLRTAIEEAQRFLRRAQQFNAARQCSGDVYWGNGTRSAGDVRRASLDLTRALADLRKSQ